MDSKTDTTELDCLGPIIDDLNRGAVQPVSDLNDRTYLYKHELYLANNLPCETGSCA